VAERTRVRGKDPAFLLAGRLAPFGAEDLAWFAGMTPSGAAELRAAATGRAALEAHFAAAKFDPDMFTPANHAALFSVMALDWLREHASHG
jgi:hypothetical protein